MTDGASIARVLGALEGPFQTVLVATGALEVGGCRPEKALRAVTAEALTAQFTLNALKGGTFTISNLGAVGGTYSPPIINPPEICILTTEAVVKRPIVRETPEGDVLAVRSMMNLCLSFDHRIMDGAPAAQFLQRIIAILESPYQILI